MVIIILALVAGIYGYIGVWKSEGEVNLKNFLIMALFVLLIILSILAFIEGNFTQTDCGDFNQGPCYSTFVQPHPGTLSLMHVLEVFGAFIFGTLISFYIKKQK